MNTHLSSAYSLTLAVTALLLLPPLPPQLAAIIQQPLLPQQLLEMSEIM